MSDAYRVDSSATSPFATSIVKFVCCRLKTVPPPPPRKGLGGGDTGAVSGPLLVTPSISAACVSQKKNGVGNNVLSWGCHEGCCVTFQNKL